ncbi:ankyrin-2-like [Anthonomus grandis grandis]|uniref:ankyrin-2-like n=1 Tax=Anthonomus grandis grandis TaxID=2921223 RepID=UPI002165E67D|nr:ankyrin-2-like [Anthonomus grandis grandis]
MESSDEELPFDDHYYEDSCSESDQYDDGDVDEDIRCSGPLAGAVAKGNLERVQQLIYLGTSPNAKGKNDDSPLHYAICNAQFEVLDYLLSLEDIDVNAQNSFGQTPLFYAVTKNQLHIVKKLVDHNADIKISCKYGSTLLHVSTPYPDIVHFLILNGADIDAKDNNGNTPLHIAVDEESLETICMLLYYNADANNQCKRNYTPFMRAICLRNVEIQTVLLDYVSDFNVINNRGEPILHLALLFSSPLIKELIDRGTEVNYEIHSKPSIIFYIWHCKFKVFDIVWPKVQDQPLRGHTSYFEAMLCTWTPPEKRLPRLLRAMIDIGNVSPILTYFDFTRFYSPAKCKTHKEKFETLMALYPQLAIDLIYIYLGEGKPLNGELISKIYELFGYCKFLRICLHMDIQKAICGNVNMGLIFYDPLMSVDELKKRIINSNDTVNEEQFLPYIKILNSGKKSLTVTKIQGIPSLKELSRNTLRDVLVLQHNLSTSSKYYFFIQNMRLPDVYKDILAFKQPIYKS